MQEAAELIIPMLAIILTFSIPIIYMGVRYAERKDLIERGVDMIEYTRVLREGSDPRRGLFNTLRLGLIGMFIGIGILIGNAFHIHHPAFIDEDTAMFSSILMFGGLGLILYYLIVSKLTKK